MGGCQRWHAIHRCASIDRVLGEHKDVLWRFVLPSFGQPTPKNSNARSITIQYDLSEVLSLVSISLSNAGYAERGARGYAGVESGFVLARNPGTVRGPDVYYVRADRMPSSGAPRNFWNIAPDLAVEVVLPGETADEVRDKVHDYLTAGTPLVWVVYPRSKEVVAHTPDGLARTYSGDDWLEDPAVLSDFSCPVSSLFD